MNDTQRIAALARRFPTLQSADGLYPWAPEVLDAWATSGAPGSGAQHAVRFILAVWNDGRPWQSGPFNLIEAVRTWDAAHLNVVRHWLGAPWLP